MDWAHPSLARLARHRAGLGARSARWGVLALLLSSSCYQAHERPGASGRLDAAPAQDCGVEICNGVSDDCDANIDEDASCPCPVVQHASHAYMFCTARSTWSDGRTLCRSVGYDLAELDDGAESAWVFASAMAREGDVAWYFGLTDAAVEGDWRTADGRAPALLMFASGEPNSFFADEDCADLMPDQRGAWNDDVCAFEQPFVCEVGP